MGKEKEKKSVAIHQNQENQGDNPEPPERHSSRFRLSAAAAPQLISKSPWQTSDRLRSLTSSYRILPAFPQSLIFPFSDG